jgi:hypothetical protein
MPDDKLPYDVSWRGPLGFCSGEQRTLAVALIDQFMHAFSQDDTIEWSPRNSQARRGLVKHPRDTNLRIDLQSTFPDRARPARRWASFYLEDGTASKSYAHLEMECGLTYSADDVRSAWLASLSNGLSATMIWSPSEFQRLVLATLRDDAPRSVDEIVRDLTMAHPVGEEDLQPLRDRLQDALRVLTIVECVASEVNEDRPDLGNCYALTAKAAGW